MRARAAEAGVLRARVAVVARHWGMRACAVVAGIDRAGVTVVALGVRGAHQRGGGEGVEAAGAGRIVEPRWPDVDRAAAQCVLDVGRRQGGILGEEERRDGGRVRCGGGGAGEGAGGGAGGGGARGAGGGGAGAAGGGGGGGGGRGG